MGCSSSHEGYNLASDYKARQLPEPDAKFYTCEFEKEAYMAINVFRADPKSMVPHIRVFKKNQNYKG